MSVTKQNIIDYVNHTPYNTNVNILGNYLDDFSGGGNSGQQMLDDFIAGESSIVTYNGEIVRQYSFYGKPGIEEVYLPNAIYIGHHAFSVLMIARMEE